MKISSWVTTIGTGILIGGLSTVGRLVSLSYPWSSIDTVGAITVTLIGCGIGFMISVIIEHR